MSVEKYYQDTLEKWQDIANGKRKDTGRRCGFCAFTATTQYYEEVSCRRCPVLVVWPDVDNCVDLVAIEDATNAGETGDALLLQMAAGSVVALLEENKDALIKAMQEIVDG